MPKKYKPDANKTVSKSCRSPVNHVHIPREAVDDPPEGRGVEELHGLPEDVLQQRVMQPLGGHHHAQRDVAHEGQSAHRW